MYIYNKNYFNFRANETRFIFGADLTEEEFQRQKFLQEHRIINNRIKSKYYFSVFHCGSTKQKYKTRNDQTVCVVIRNLTLILLLPQCPL